MLKNFEKVKKKKEKKKGKSEVLKSWNSISKKKLYIKTKN